MERTTSQSWLRRAFGTQEADGFQITSQVKHRGGHSLPLVGVILSEGRLPGCSPGLLLRHAVRRGGS